MVQPSDVIKSRTPVRITQGTVEYLDKNDQPQPLGRIEMEDYTGHGGGKHIMRHNLIPASGSPFIAKGKKAEKYTLGTGPSLAFVEPAQIQQAVVDLGYTAKDQFAGVGGARMTTIYVPKDPVAIPDPITWDHEFWAGMATKTDLQEAKAQGGHQRIQEGLLFPAITVNTNLVMGYMATTVQEGFYRLWCTNGAFSTYLELPEINQAHKDWDPSKFGEALGVFKHEGYAALPMGPMVGQVDDLYKALTILDRFIAERDTKEGLPSKIAFLQEEFSAFNKANLSPVILRAYSEQLHWIAQVMDPGAPLHTMDLVNAYTNAINSTREKRNEDTGVWFANNRLDNVIKTTQNFIRLANIFA